MRKWIVAFLVAYTTCTAMQMQAQEILPTPNAVVAARKGFDFRGVNPCDKDYQGFYAIRVAELASLPGTEEFFGVIRAALTDPANGVGMASDIKITEIEQIAGRLRFEVKHDADSDIPDGKRNSAVGSFDVGQLRLARDVDWNAELRKAFRETKELHHKGKPYYECAMPPAIAGMFKSLVKEGEKPRFYFMPLDARTLAVTDEDKIKEWIDGTARTPVTGLETADWGTNTIVIAVPDVAGSLAASLRKIIDTKELLPVADAVRKEATDRLEGLRFLRVGIQSGDSLAFQLEAGTKSKVEADYLARALRDLLALARKNEPSGSVGTRAEFIERSLMELPRLAIVENKGETVRVAVAPRPFRAVLETIPAESSAKAAEPSRVGKPR